MDTATKIEERHLLKPQPVSLYVGEELASSGIFHHGVVTGEAY